MKLLLASLSLGILFAIRSVGAAGLELYPFITIDASGDAWLSLRITNRGESEQTVLTENYTYSFAGWLNGQRLPYVDLRFNTTTTGTKDNPEEWKFVPSLPKLGPVTLRKGETATSAIKLDRELVAAIQKMPDRLVAIRYTIGEEIAQRYSLWHGTLEVGETGRSLLSK